ncbi:MAG: methylenetetrahydrofolate reductase [Dehalococcoidia bacterium]
MDQQVPPGTLLRQARFEVIPMRGVVEEVTFLPPASIVTVTGSPRKGIEATLDLSEQLAARGFQVVPHLMARLVRSRDHLRQILDRLEDHRMEEVFVIGGDVPVPAGPYDSAGSLIAQMFETTNRPKRIGIAAYPEGHPLISSSKLLQALREKQRLADYMVTQICFDPATIMRWLAGIREQGIKLPVYLGIPGVLKRKKLLEISLRVGVGDSTRFLTNHVGMITRLLRSPVYSPDVLVTRTLAVAGDASLPIAGFHIYTFNQCQATERWRQKAIKLCL